MFKSSIKMTFATSMNQFGHFSLFFSFFHLLLFSNFLNGVKKKVPKHQTK